MHVPAAPAVLTGAAGILLLLATLSLGPAEARPRCGGKKATIVGTPGRDVLKAPGNGNHVIYGGGGNDVIVAKAGKDVICGGPGSDTIRAGESKDRIYGQGGNDYIDGEGGGDQVDGGPGADIIVGSGGADKVKGGSGDDIIRGGIQDDTLAGGGGNDVIGGDQGVDKLSGGSGSDLLRGDSNDDRYSGGGGSDTASFAMATPPRPGAPGGVSVSLPAGRASGDDSREKLATIENLIGSQFPDTLQGKGGGSVDGSLGSDSCSGFAARDCQNPAPPTSTAYVAQAGSADPGLVLFGDRGADSWRVSGAGATIRIASSTPLAAGPGCTASPGVVICALAPAQTGWVLAWGAGGNDAVTFGGGFSGRTSFKGDGGPGNDVLRGSSNGDLLTGGTSGSDRLFGNAGDDGLISRGRDGDQLIGGPGGDNLASGDACGNHLLKGGPGISDVAGFGLVNGSGVVARIGGRAKLKGKSCKGTLVSASNEILEGTRFADTLIASNSRDLLIGRAGHDRCIGGQHLHC